MTITNDHDIILDPKHLRAQSNIINPKTQKPFMEGDVFHFKLPNHAMSGRVLVYFDYSCQQIRFRDIREETSRRGRRTYDEAFMKDGIFKPKGSYYDDQSLNLNVLQKITILSNYVAVNRTQQLKFKAKSTLSAEELDAKGIPHDELWVTGAYLDGYILSGIVEANDEYITIETWAAVDKNTVTLVSQ